MQPMSSLSVCLDQLGCIIGVLIAVYATMSAHSGSSPRLVDFVICSCLLGIYLYGQIMPFFGDGVTIFGCLGFGLVMIGGLVGGVVGVLLPKSSAGLSLGVFASLFTCTMLELINSNMANNVIRSSIFITLIPLCIFFVLSFENFAVPLRTALGCGMILALVVGKILNSTFLSTIYSILLLMSPPSSGSMLPFLVWVLGTVISFIVQSNLNGNMKKWRFGGYEQLPTSPSVEFNKIKASEQRTFSYPDTLEFNYFDPDSLPRHLQAQGDAVFSTVQELASELGFQVDSSRNQAEHLLMMLSNEQSTPEEHTLTEPTNRLHSKLFANYKKWCDRVGSSPSFLKSETSLSKKPSAPYTAQIEDILLFLLIWGEAANLRHAPECLCFLFHKTMQTHQSNVREQKTNISSRSKEHLYPGYFLDHVIIPIYDVVAAGLKGKGDHEQRRTYDDFNEFFWSPSCLKYEIVHSPMESKDLVENWDNQYPSEPTMVLAQALALAPKTYVEKRSYFHGMLSFHRVLEWHAIAFTILTCVGMSNDLVWTVAYTLQTASVVFIEINMFSIFWMCLEVWANYPSSSISNPSICGYVLRLGASYILLVYQCIYFYWAFDLNNQGNVDDGMRSQGDNNFWWWQYVWLSLFSLSVYFIESFLCWFPSITSALMCWNNDMVQAILNICYPFSQLYVGKKLHVSQWKVCKYILFWATLLVWKLFFGFNFITNPITTPTIELYDDYMNFLDASFLKTFILLCIWWIPHYLVFMIDLSIWYSLWSSFVGAFAALTQRMGAVRDSDSLREHFMRAPHAFCQRLMPLSSKLSGFRGPPSQNEIVQIDPTTAKKNPPKIEVASKITRVRMSSNDLASLQIVPSSPIEEVMQVKVEGTDNRLIGFLDVRTQRWVIFSRVWNEFMSSLRDNDHISHTEKEMYVFSNDDIFSKPVYLPLFQTAGCVEQAVTSYIGSSSAYHHEEVPHKKVLIWERLVSSTDISTKEAVSEAWELTAWSLSKLMGTIHLSDMSMIISCFTKWASSDDLYSKMNADSLPGIIDHIVGIINALKSSFAKRKKSPLVTVEIRSMQGKRSSNNEDVSVGQENNVEHSKPAKMKKSVSTGFLTALHTDQTSKQESEKNNSANSAQQVKKPQFTKLQPFRKNVVLHDTTRDKIREDFRNLLISIKNALNRTTKNHSDTKDIIDRITFTLSMENGFLWDDVYASSQIDEFSRDQFVLVILTKLIGLLKLRKTQVELASLEARRRINFFMNSLFMDMPSVPSLRYSKEYTVMTPFYSEDVLLTRDDLEQKNEDGVTTLLYLKTLYQKDWTNFLERTGATDDQAIWTPKFLQDTRMWASMRAQTLFRTVDGMMQSEAAVRLLGELEQLNRAEIDLFAKLKFSYVVACQVYGQMKKNLEHKADDLEFLLARYPNLRIAYIDAVRVDRSGDLAYYSVLVKADPNSGLQPLPKGNKVKEVYRVKLPGNPVLGEGKPENQNHAIIFSRGRYLQAIDMNQDGYLEEAFKMRNLLEEFNAGHAIIGFREHIFTGTVSSVANYMALQELSFVSLGQRVLTDPLNIRQHYGHPDVFDKMFIMTEGGMSKASRGINLSEDVFAGFNATIRGHTVGFKEYLQVGKGRDVGLQQTYKFEAKLAQGNAEQTLSRDMYRICERLDFFRLMSFYYGGVGHYVANAMIMFTLITLVYFMLGLAVFDEEGVDGRPMAPEGPIQLALAGMGLLQTMPLVMTLVVEKGVWGACREIGYMFLSGGPLYFIFQIQTKSYFFQQTILAGGASYKATGRGFVTRHSPFDENYRFFASSHIYLGFELFVALILYKHYSVTHQYLGLTWSLWLVAISFLFGAFWFNPLSFETSKVVEDYAKWCTWMSETGGSPDQSWEIWYNEEIAFIKPLTLSWKIFLAVMRCTIWLVIGGGILGPGFFSNSTDKEKYAAVFVILFMYYFCNWVLCQLERSLSYAARRFSSLTLSFVCVGMLVYLFHAHKDYFGYTLSFYYIGSALCFFSLLSGIGQPRYFYKMHDYLVGHSIFFVLYVLSIVQLGILQTWLLYHNALSSGVAIEDILKYASRSKERGDESEALLELRTQVADQERTLKALLQTVQLTGVATTERTGLLANAAFSNTNYGAAKTQGNGASLAIKIPIPPPTKVETSKPVAGSLDKQKSTFTAGSLDKPKSSFKSSPSDHNVTSSTSSSLAPAPVKDFKAASKTIVEDITMDSPPVDPNFSFVQPMNFPKR